MSHPHAIHWIRPRFRSTGRIASVELVAFGRDRLELAGMSAAASGSPGHHELTLVELTLHRRSDDARWFDRWREGSFRTLAFRDLSSLRALDSARLCYRIRVTVPDPSDLGHLQGAWACAYWLARTGCVAILDVSGSRWHRPSHVRRWRVDRAFALDREIRVLAMDPASGARSILQTCGMAKFARPDLLAMPSSRRRTAAERALRTLALRTAEGEILSPGTEVNLPRVGTVRIASAIPAPSASLLVRNDRLLVNVE